ncbi:MAG: CHAT domain-containing protein [Saprospirales bacterium]|nr:CHAT domain-containing protein [Saprospirales bacterium]
MRDSLAALRASGDEVAAIANLWKGKSVYRQAATLDAFRQLAPRYRILHLSTHGQADDRNGDYAFLAFRVADEHDAYSKLYARDLYNLEINADLVVLSACETGTGKLQRGEGIVSLARAFAYSGAKSLITTLWKVNDTSTKDLMIRFYQYLKAGRPKDAALQLAKKDYLASRQAGGGAALHPFFWAGFIAIGDMEPLR